MALGIAFTKDAATFYLRKEVAGMREDGERHVSKVIIQYTFMDCPLCSYNDEQDRLSFQIFQCSRIKDKKIHYINAMGKM